MARANPYQAAVNAGEFSARMVARTDFAKYAAAGARVENLLPLPQGGLARRPGTRYVTPIKDETKKARLFDFEFSNQQAYIIEGGEGYFRFYRNGGQIVAPQTDATITNGTFDSDTTGWSDISTGAAKISHDATNQRLNLDGVAGQTAAAEQAVSVGGAFQAVEHIVTFDSFGAPGDEVEIQIGTVSGGKDILAALALGTGHHAVAFTPNVATFHLQFRNNDQAKTLQIDNVRILSNEPVEVGTPYAEGDLFNIKWAQTADVVYYTHPVNGVRKLERRGDTTWSMVEVLFLDGPYLDRNEDSAKTLTFSAANGLGVSCTATGHSPFAATDVGRAIRITSNTASAEWGWAVIVAYVSPGEVTVDIKRTVPTTAQSDWRLGAWSGTTGYPAALTFFEQRSIYARTTLEPQTFDLSQSADLENMRPDSFVENANETQADDAFRYTIAADQVNPILWLSGGQRLVFGTSSAEWTVESDGPTLTPDDIQVRRQTSHGSADVPPIRTSNVVLMLQRARRKLREFAYRITSDSYQAVDLTILADHILRSGITEMTYQQEPDSTVWAVRNDGVAGALTYKRSQDVVGWGRQILGGLFGNGNAVVDSMRTIPGSGSVQGQQCADICWMIVKRTINGQTRRYVEYFTQLFEGPNPEEYDDEDSFRAATLAAQPDAVCVDSSIEYSGPPATVLTGLDHLEGQTAKIYGDGAIHPDQIVQGGQITLQVAVSKAQVGLAYRHVFKTLKVEAGAVAGTAVGKRKRMNQLVFVLLHTQQLNYGTSLQELRTPAFRVTDDAMDTAVPLFTGEVRVTFDDDWDPDSRIYVAGDEPAPFIMLAIAPELVTQDVK